jgi:hypothetical protein
MRAIWLINVRFKLRKCLTPFNYMRGFESLRVLMVFRLDPHVHIKTLDAIAAKKCSAPGLFISIFIAACVTLKSVAVIYATFVPTNFRAHTNAAKMIHSLLCPETIIQMQIFRGPFLYFIHTEVSVFLSHSLCL